MKNKLNQDQIAMLLADWHDGEYTKCDCECVNCPLDKTSSNYGVSLCLVLGNISEDLCEEE